MNRSAVSVLLATTLVGCGGGGSSGGASVDGFSIEASRQSIAASAGSRHQVALSVQTATDFAEPIQFDVENSSPDLTVSLTPDGMPTGTGTLEIRLASDPAPGSHMVTVVGRSTTLTRTRVITVHALDGSSSNGLLLTLPPRALVRAGQSTACMLEITRERGAIGDVDLTLAPLPGGPTASFDTSSTGTDSALLQVTAGAGTEPGTYPVSVSASVGNKTGTTTCLVEVVDAAAATDRWISRIEFAQSYFASDLEFVRGRPVLARVHALADRVGTPSPPVELVGRVNGTEVGRLVLTGPATMPTAEKPDSLNESYHAEIPSSWVQPGLQLIATLDPDQSDPDRDSTNDSITRSPTIGGGPDLDVVVVPLVVGGRTASPASFDTALFAYWPVETVNVTVRAPYTITSVADVQPNGDNWNQVLSELASLRASDGSSAYYYGAIDLNYNSGVFGLGYVGFPASVGADHSVSTMIHEIGHNFGLSHAPCGGAAGTDPNYPHPGGAIGRWGYDSRTGQIMSPGNRNDVMGYCGWKWVSAFHYEKVRDRIDVGASVASLVAAAPEPLVTLDGWLADDGSVTFERPRRRVGVRPSTDPASSHRIGVVFNGQLAHHPVSLHEIGCGPSDPRGRRFSITIPDLGNLEKVQLWQGDRKLGESQSATIPDAHGLTWEEADGILSVSWNATKFASLSVVHCGMKRTTLAIGLTGGSAAIKTVDLPAGGAFEFSIEGKLDGRCIAAPR